MICRHLACAEPVTIALRGLCDTHYRQLWSRGGPRPLCTDCHQIVTAPGRCRQCAEPPTCITDPRTARYEDALWLLECGEHPEEVARRVGTTLTALYALLRRRPTPAEYLRRVSAETARVRRAA